MSQGVLRQLRCMEGILCATKPCTASSVGEHVFACLPTPEDFSNGCQLLVHWIRVQAKPSYPSTKPKSGVSPMRAREVEIERGKVKFSMHAEMNFDDVPCWVLFADVAR